MLQECFLFLVKYILILWSEKGEERMLSKFLGKMYLQNIKSKILSSESKQYVMVQQYPLLVFDFFMKILYYNELIGDMLCLV
jgi:hypothetical protein